LRKAGTNGFGTATSVFSTVITACGGIDRSRVEQLDGIATRSGSTRRR
jgi:hypothetical protein